jgi:hypothetical protein
MFRGILFAAEFTAINTKEGEFCMRGKKEFRPYIGVTGFMTEAEVEGVLTAIPQTPDYDLMVGGLMSSKTLHGLKNKWPGRYPKKEDFENIFLNHPNVLNLIHYNTDSPKFLAKELYEAAQFGGHWLDGFQLNIAWPNPVHIEAFKDSYPNAVFVLQVGRGAMADCSNSPKMVAKILWEQYLNVVDAVLIDPSGGKGEPMDVAMMDAYLAAIYETHASEQRIHCVVAGGLCAATVPSINSLLAKYPGLSMDAEGKLRTPQPEDKLSLPEAIDYVSMGYIETVAHCKA